MKKIHRMPSDQEYKTMSKVRDRYIDKAAHSTGVISRGFAALSFSSFFHQIIQNKKML